jgi:hypothetical protein
VASFIRSVASKITDALYEAYSLQSIRIEAELEIFGTVSRIHACRTIEIERKRRKINEADRYAAAHDGLVAGSVVGEPPTKPIANQQRLCGGARFRPGFRKLSKAAAVARTTKSPKTKNVSPTSPFACFGIQFYDAPSTSILPRHR